MKAGPGRGPCSLGSFAALRTPRRCLHQGIQPVNQTLRCWSRHESFHGHHPGSFVTPFPAPCHAAPGAGPNGTWWRPARCLLSSRSGDASWYGGWRLGGAQGNSCALLLPHWWPGLGHHLSLRLCSVLLGPASLLAPSDSRVCCARPRNGLKRDTTALWALAALSPTSVVQAAPRLLTAQSHGQPQRWPAPAGRSEAGLGGARSPLMTR